VSKLVRTTRFWNNLHQITGPCHYPRKYTIQSIHHWYTCHPLTLNICEWWLQFCLGIWAIFLAKLGQPFHGHNLLITGYPGTGKSFTVHIAEQLQKQARNVVLTATTGKAVQALQEKLSKYLSKIVTTTLYLETR
jgi:Cdc6-like AAA superfamily ATPase